MSPTLPFSFLCNTSSPKGTTFIFKKDFEISQVTCREKNVTLLYNELYDFDKVCAKLRQENKGEIVNGTISKDEFMRLQKKQIDKWCSSGDHKVLKPVRYIGPQVNVLSS